VAPNSIASAPNALARLGGRPRTAYKQRHFAKGARKGAGEKPALKDMLLRKRGV